MTQDITIYTRIFHQGGRVSQNWRARRLPIVKIVWIGGVSGALRRLTMKYLPIWRLMLSF